MDEHGASPDSNLVPLSATGSSRTSGGHFGSAAVGRLSAEGSNTVKGKPSTVDISLQGVRRESSLTYKGESKRDALSILLRYAARTRNGLVQYQAMEKTNKGRHSSKASWRSLVSACVSFLQNVLNSIPTLQLHRLEDLIILKTASQGVLAPLFWLHAPLRL